MMIEKHPLNKKIKTYLRLIFLSTLSGLLAGFAAAVFLISLDWATQTRLANPQLIWALPFAGFLIGWLYHHHGRDSAAGNNLILDEIHDPKKTIPIAMAPLILIGTLLTHLFGGSAGREGTAVQMGASLSDQLSRFFKMNAAERKILLAAGAGAGFGAAIGAPWAGVIFGMEVIHIGRIKFFAWFECLIASFVGYFFSVYLGAPHSHFPKISVDAFSFKLLFFVLIAGILFGFTAKIFSVITHFIERINSYFSIYPPLKIFMAGVLIVLLYDLEGTYRYAGLGISYIQEALLTPGGFKDPTLKTFFTGLTIGTGFKGGEFIPLVFIGTTLGSALSVILPISVGLLGALGFAAVFAGASNTPLACSLMAIEIFGLEITPYALVACFASYYFSGHQGIYKSQRILIRKHQRFLNLLSWFRELPKRFFKKINLTVFKLGLVSFFADVASEMLYPITPIFLTAVLGASMSSLGLIEGVAESMASLLKSYSGSWSDHISRRKPFLILGYLLGAISKPMIGSSSSWTQVLGARALDRTGKGLRSAPRDALIADSVKASSRGAAFGWHRAMDTAGAALGPLLALVFMSLNPNHLRDLYFWALIPGLLSVVVIFSIQEKTPTSKSSIQNQAWQNPLKIWPQLSLNFKKYLFAWTLFSLVNSSDVFLLMKAKSQGVSLQMIILLYCAFNLTYAFSSPYLGKLSDRIARKKLMMVGLAVFTLVYLGFSQATNLWQFWVLFLLYGFYMGATEGVGKALAIDFSPKYLKATSLGLLGTFTGFSTLGASAIAGLLWDHLGAAWPFFFGALGATLTILLLSKLPTLTTSDSKI